MIRTSVIIAVFNRIAFVKHCLLSLQHQSIFPDEVIITDDGSQTDIVSPIRELISDAPFKTIYVKQQHKGFRLAKCRNNGVRTATGEYLVFVDQDLIFTKNFIKTFLDHRKERQFCVSYPIRLSGDQTKRCTDAVVRQFNFDPILEKKQIEKIHRQYRKDRLYFFLKKLRLREIGPKLRGGVAAINREDFQKVNGYDEQYQGWGNEDDDLGRRLYQAGIIGTNPFFHEFPLHLYHPPHHVDGRRCNQEYYQQRIQAIRKGEYVCRFGYEHPLDEDDEEITVVNLN
jgi:GT2 family glycosyltransferase